MDSSYWELKYHKKIHIKNDDKGKKIEKIGKKEIKFTCKPAFNERD